MADGIAGTDSQSGPKCTDQRYLGHVDQEFLSIMTDYSYNGVTFHILTSAVKEELPAGYDLNSSIEGKLLLELNDIHWGTQTEEKDSRTIEIHREFEKLSGDVCFPLMQELAPATPLPKARTLQDFLYPAAYTLQVLTKDDKLIARRLHNYTPADEHLPIPEEKLEAMDLDEDLTVFNPSQVVLRQQLQKLIWKVDVDGESMLCKITFDSQFWNSLSNELAIYQKIRGAGDELLVPQLKGTVEKHPISSP